MSERVLVSTRKGLFTVERRGAVDWRIANVSFLADNVTLTFPDARDGTCYAALDHGHFGVKVQRSRDGGATWEERPCPEYPPQPEGEVDINPMSQKPIPWKLVRIWALEGGGPDRPNRLWCGTLPGGLFKSENGGESWELVRPLWDHPSRKVWFGGGAELAAIHSICVDPRNSQHVRVGVSCGGVWETLDGGDSWTVRAQGMWAAYMPPEQKDDPNIQDVHRIVQCPGAPDIYWVQHHNGIFRTTDNSRTWQEVTDVSPSSFGFAVAVHPADGNTAWFVPATKDEKRIPVDGRVVVTRTRNGGQSFDQLTAGLPNEHAYDLVFRHALDVDRTGNRLAFGSTTGSLWVSEDQGDHWHTVSTHLPPIHAVRFVS